MTASTTQIAHTTTATMDVTHIKYIPKVNNTLRYYGTIMYLDAVVASDYSCCGDGSMHIQEQCDDANNTS